MRGRFGRRRAIRARTLRCVGRVSASDRAFRKVFLAKFPPAPATIHWRPVLREDCLRVARPCPYVGCRHNVYLDVVNGNIKLNFPDLDPSEMPARESCALDLADEGGIQIERVGVLLNLTRERVRQMMQAMKKRLRKSSL